MLTAIYNVFDGEEFLEDSIRYLNGFCKVICITQKVSNFGEIYEGGHNEAIRLKEIGLVDEVYCYHPKSKMIQGELEKRNFGISQVKTEDFIFIDCDEFYLNLEEMYNLYKSKGLDGSLCQIKTYFKNKDWTFGIEDYHVPMFHKKRMAGFGMNLYKGYRTDPTRGVKCEKWEELPCTMYHFSWIRKDIDRKIRNSSARRNIEKSGIIKQYANAKIGMFINLFEKKIIFEANPFKIKWLEDSK